MNARVAELRERSLATRPSISAERSLILTRFYREHLGRHSTPVLRALAFRELCEHKTITIEPGELIVGERGPAPKATPLFPELTCHSADDLRILDSAPPDAATTSRRTSSTPTRTRSSRTGAAAACATACSRSSPASGTTPTRPACSRSSWSSGRRATRWPTARSTPAAWMDFTADIDAAAAAVEVGVDPRAGRRLEELRAMRIAADAAVRFAERHAELAERHGRRGAGRHAPRGARADRRRLPPRPGACPRATSGRRSRCTGSATWR